MFYKVSLTKYNPPLICSLFNYLNSKARRFFYHEAHEVHEGKTKQRVDYPYVNNRCFSFMVKTEKQQRSNQP